MFARNEVIVPALGWEAVVGFAAEKGKEITFHIPEEGTLMFMDCLVIPTDAPNRDVAYDLANVCTSVEGQLKLRRGSRPGCRQPRRDSHGGAGEPRHVPLRRHEPDLPEGHASPHAAARGRRHPRDLRRHDRRVRAFAEKHERRPPPQHRPRPSWCGCGASPSASARWRRCARSTSRSTRAISSRYSARPGAARPPCCA